MMNEFRCICCDTVGKWKNVDEFRLSKKGMAMCEVCGFVTYPESCSNVEKMNDHYRNHEYREAPSVNNLFAGERKIHYHGAFLGELFDEWKRMEAEHFAESTRIKEAYKEDGECLIEEFKHPKVLEIGAAFGMVLKWIQSQFPKAEVSGTELTLSFRRNAWWLYNIRLDEVPDFTKKYDLIISYKVAEHIPNMDIELRKYAEALSENGKLYISVPTWFNDLTNFGLSGFDIEYYYDPNHVNVWSRPLFEGLLKKCGLRVIKEDHLMYNDTYLCVRDDSLMSEPKKFDDPSIRLDELRRVLVAAKAAMEHRFEDALNTWKHFPEAYQNYYEVNRSKVHREGFDEIKAKFIDPLIENCASSFNALIFCADLCMRYEKYEQALDFLNRALEIRRNDPAALMALGHVFRNLAVKYERSGDMVAKEKMLHEARKVMIHIQKVSQQMKSEATTWMMQDNARLPMPFEEKKS